MTNAAKLHRFSVMHTVCFVSARLIFSVFVFLTALPLLTVPEILSVLLCNCNAVCNVQGFEQYLCEMMPDNIKTDDAGNVTWVDERVQGTVRGTFEQAHREQVVLSERARTSTMTASAPAAAAEVAPSESVTGGGLNTDRDTEQTEQARAPAAVLDSDAAASLSETASTSSSAPAPESTAAASSDDPVHVPL